MKAAKSAAPAAAKAPAPAAPPSAPPAAAGKGARRKTTTVRRQAISAELGDSKKSAAYVPKKIDKAANISADLVVALRFECELERLAVEDDLQPESRAREDVEARGAPQLLNLRLVPQPQILDLKPALRLLLPYLCFLS